MAPETGWLEGTGLSPDGIPVSVGGRTAIPDVFAAGEVAAVFEPRLGRHMRTEHWDSAARGGAATARTMLGEGEKAPPLPSFWSDQYGHRISYVGHAGIADDHRIEGDGSGRELTVVYEREGSPVAALTIDQPRRLAELRRQIDLTHTNSTKTRDGEGSMSYIPTIDVNACAAHGDCVDVAPEVFALEDTAVVIGDGPDDLIMQAAEICPSIAITVVDSKTGAQVYP